jgi:hypothetical protein
MTLLSLDKTRHSSSNHSLEPCNGQYRLEDLISQQLQCPSPASLQCQGEAISREPSESMVIYNRCDNFRMNTGYGTYSAAYTMVALSCFNDKLPCV